MPLGQPVPLTLQAPAPGRDPVAPGTWDTGCHSCPPMAAFFTAALKSLQGGRRSPPRSPPKDGKAATLPNNMAREEFEEYQRQLLEEKIERDKAFAQRKAERVTVRIHLRDKYHLAQDERDDAQLHVAGSAVELLQELAAMVQSEEEEEEEEEEGGAGAFAFLTKLREVDLPALQDRALGSVDEVKEKCALM
ncbi:LOW QUALITY PROTEIN: complexin-3-like [Aptenodytes patagonicus]|uniref:LOW QUALITY PROTEIN: complexin-3-like n=1 Tax=Aptenodytes patagonicus TaxID=9234 RepID=UPI003FA05826